MVLRDINNRSSLSSHSSHFSASRQTPTLFVLWVVSFPFSHFIFSFFFKASKISDCPLPLWLCPPTHLSPLPTFSSLSSRDFNYCFLPGAVSLSLLSLHCNVFLLLLFFAFQFCLDWIFACGAVAFIQQSLYFSSCDLSKQTRPKRGDWHDADVYKNIFQASWTFQSVGLIGRVDSVSTRSNLWKYRMKECPQEISFL